ncbi:MAG: 8-amino-7-oxononanoate synthase [Deltaproteobacteria bacterium]|nr:MAG: 8-amino-7-oxononanoate synthase [Deltaproteobacteria bacterium]
MDFVKEELEEIKKKGLYRSLRLIEGEQGPEVSFNGRRIVMLCSNNYLGLANHPRVKEAAIEAVRKYGCGSGSSRLISGNMELHQELERKIASFKHAEAALVFGSGYLCNLGVIDSLMGEDDVILSDELNHASIIDGARLSRARVKIYPHKDLNVLEKELKQLKGYRRKLVVTDGVFSMDGDIAPLPGIVELAKKYKAMTMVDEAHATGVMGQNGRGCVEHFDLEGKVDIQMGTLGKALGSLGAYVAGEKKLIDFLINRARGFIYTTALPPPLCAAAITAIEIITQDRQLRNRLWENAKFLKEGLQKIELPVGNPETPIIPIVIGESSTTMRMCEILLQSGVYAQGIRPPTVPEGSSRIRTTVMATHNQEHLIKALEAFKAVRGGLIQGRAGSGRGEQEKQGFEQFNPFICLMGDFLWFQQIS